LHDLNGVEQFFVRLKGIDDGKLAALATSEVEEGYFRFVR
jgi:hypothetical protein